MMNYISFFKSTSNKLLFNIKLVDSNKGILLPIKIHVPFFENLPLIPSEMYQTFLCLSQLIEH